MSKARTRKPQGASRPADTKRWNDLCVAAYAAAYAVPDDARAELLKVVGRICDIGDTFQVPPRTMAAALATTIATLSMVEMAGNVHDNAGFDDFLEWAYAAMHAAVAASRIASGWTPSGPN